VVGPRKTIVSTGSQGTLFYVVKTANGYSVWQATPEEVFDRTREDPTLNARLDRTPFATRAEAQATSAAVSTLLKIMIDTDSPPTLSALDSDKINGQTTEAVRRMTSRVFRRLERLELRKAAASGVTSIPIRVLLMDAERGLTGVLLLDGANPTTPVPATAEEEASVREDLARRASARIATDISY
jgi:hypothetical protein